MWQTGVTGAVGEVMLEILSLEIFQSTRSFPASAFRGRDRAIQR